MKTVVWKTSSRVIPNYGVAVPEREITLPEALADKFIAQGEAVEVKQVKRAPAREGGE